MASLNTGGFALSALPTAPEIPTNVGRFSPAEAMATQNQAMDLAEKWRTLKATQILHNADYNRQIAEHEEQLKRLPLGTQALAGEAATKSAEGYKAQALAPSQVVAGQATNRNDFEKAMFEIEKIKNPVARAAAIRGFTQDATNQANYAEIYGHALTGDDFYHQDVVTPPKKGGGAAAGPAPITTSSDYGATPAPLTPAPAPQPLAAPVPVAAPAPLTPPTPAPTPSQRLAGLTSIQKGPAGSLTKITLGAAGPKIELASQSPEYMKQQQDAADYAIAGKLNVDDYKNPQTGDYDLAKIKADAAKVVSAPIISSPATGFEFRNPEAGMDPKEAVKHRIDRIDKDAGTISEARVLDDQAADVISKMDKVDQIMAQHPELTGQHFAYNKVGSTFKLVSGLSSRVLGDKPQLANALQEIEALHNASITEVMRMKENSAKSGSSISGVGRVLQTEVPWFAGKVPGIENEAATNQVLSSRIRGAAQSIRDHNAYIATLHSEQKFIPAEADDLWLQYRRANPRFDSNGNPVTPAETTQQYFERVKAHPETAGKPIGAAPVAPTTPANAAMAPDGHPLVAIQGGKKWKWTPQGRVEVP